MGDRGEAPAAVGVGRGGEVVGEKLSLPLRAGVKARRSSSSAKRRISGRSGAAGDTRADASRSGFDGREVAA